MGESLQKAWQFRGERKGLWLEEHVWVDLFVAASTGQAERQTEDLLRITHSGTARSPKVCLLKSRAALGITFLKQPDSSNGSVSPDAPGQVLPSLGCWDNSTPHPP